MSQLELFAVLRGLGVEEDKAKAAASRFVEDTTVVTRDYLKGELQELKASLLLWLFSMLIAFTGIIGAIVKWVK
jgi:hypothetical protein